MVPLYLNTAQPPEVIQEVFYRLKAGQSCEVIIPMSCHLRRHQPGATTPMTSDTRDLVRAVRACVEASRPKQGGPYAFAKSGVMLDDLVAEADQPRTLFDHADDGKGRSPAVMAA